METLKKFYDALSADPHQVFVIMPDGQILGKDKILETDTVDSELNVFPGSFNPLHEGHKLIYDKISSLKKTFEISVNRWEKEPLTFSELEQRVSQFRWYAPVLVTNSSRFIEKCGALRFFRGLRFHVGIDTILRMRSDYGEMGIAGLPATFEVYDRDMGGGVISYPHGFKLHPKNVARSLHQNPSWVLGLSSTKIRNSSNLKGP